MSWSLEEPEWPPVCECVYDEARDEVFRGNCSLHWHEDEAPGPSQVARKPPEVETGARPLAGRAGSKALIGRKLPTRE